MVATPTASNGRLTTGDTNQHSPPQTAATDQTDVMRHDEGHPRQPFAGTQPPTIPVIGHTSRRSAQCVPGSFSQPILHHAGAGHFDDPGK